MFEIQTPRIYSIDSGVAFVDMLAARLIDHTKDDPLALAEIRILLPTRRACRALSDAFLRLSDGGTVLLPRMTPLGDIDEEELAIAEAGVPAGAERASDLPPAIPSLKRQLMLSRAVMAMPEHKMQPEQATALALELAKLIDRLATEDCDPSALRTLIKDDDKYSEHWQEVMQFLEILIGLWPTILAEEGALDPAARRNALLRGQAMLWTEAPPTTPVIAAGSTGSIPATADLLTVIASLPQGMVILPGLDSVMYDDAWEALGPTHPQFGLKQLLNHINIGRTDVLDFAASETTRVDTAERSALLSAALSPARATPPPLPSTEQVTIALNGVTRLNCPGPSEEATAIALVMRETLETPGKTCALVTPDRNLARRVAAALKRWQLDVDDSAGLPLASTPPGAFLRLVADAAEQRLAPVPLLALLKHPLTSGGMAIADFRELVRDLEIMALRGPRPGPGLKGLRNVIGNDPKSARLRPLLNICEEALAPLVDALANDHADYEHLLNTHIKSAETLSQNDTLSGAARLWAGEAGEAAANFVAELTDAIGTLGPLPGRAYAGLFDSLMAARVVRPRFGAHPRLFIWGLLEARLQHADAVVLGGLNEGTWPPTPETNPWMSRPMMGEMGLEPPERRIGLTAHDFQQVLSAPKVYLTRAERLGGAPTVPSRWLLRLDNLIERTGAQDIDNHAKRGDWLNLVEALDDAPRIIPQAPRPCPPLSARPKGLYVTQIETLIRDPYSVYARHILNLRELDPIDSDPGAADRGNIIHKVLQTFIETYPTTIPEDAERRLLEIGEHEFGDHLSRPGVRAFWWPRFERIAAWFVDWQRERLTAGWEVSFAEDTGTLVVDAVEGGFKISAKPDRIDYRPDIGLSIIDYKTGQAPSKPQVESGLSPQLPLEALIAQNGGFLNVPSKLAAELMYVSLSGGRQPGKAEPLKVDVNEVIKSTWEGVSKLIVAFSDPNRAYLSRPRPQFESRFGHYDHLARVGEWQSGGDEPE